MPFTYTLSPTYFESPVGPAVATGSEYNGIRLSRLVAGASQFSALAQPPVTADRPDIGSSHEQWTGFASRDGSFYELESTDVSSPPYYGYTGLTDWPTSTDWVTYEARGSDSLLTPQYTLLEVVEDPGDPYKSIPTAPIEAAWADQWTLLLQPYQYMPLPSWYLVGETSTIALSSTSAEDAYLYPPTNLARPEVLGWIEPGPWSASFGVFANPSPVSVEPIFTPVFDRIIYTGYDSGISEWTYQDIEHLVLPVEQQLVYQINWDADYEYPDGDCVVYSLGPPPFQRVNIEPISVFLDGNNFDNYQYTLARWLIWPKNRGVRLAASICSVDINPGDPFIRVYWRPMTPPVILGAPGVDEFFNPAPQNGPVPFYGIVPAVTMTDAEADVAGVDWQLLFEISFTYDPPECPFAWYAPEQILTIVNEPPVGTPIIISRDLVGNFWESIDPVSFEIHPLPLEWTRTVRAGREGPALIPGFAPPTQRV